MSSKSGASAASWVRQMLLEMTECDYRTTSAAAFPERVKNAEQVRDMYALHVVTDCNSLHECVLKSAGGCEDKRCAIDIMAVKEMLIQERYEDDSDVEEEAESGILRLTEKELKDYFLWTVSEDQKGDILTKDSDVLGRNDWHERIAWVSIRSKKRTDARKAMSIPSRPRAGVDKKLATVVLAEKTKAARVAGFQV